MKRKALIGVLLVLALFLTAQLVLAYTAPGGGHGGRFFCCDDAVIEGFFNYADCDFGCHTRGLGHCSGWSRIGCYVHYDCSYGSFNIGPFGHWSSGACAML